MGSGGRKHRPGDVTRLGLEDEVLTTDAQVVAALARNAHPTYGDLQEATGIPKRTLHASLHRLRGAGMVDFEDDRHGTIRATFGLVVGVVG